jgi:hypothetical protein
VSDNQIDLVLTYTGDMHAVVQLVQLVKRALALLMQTSFVYHGTSIPGDVTCEMRLVRDQLTQLRIEDLAPSSLVTLHAREAAVVGSTQKPMAAAAAASASGSLYTGSASGLLRPPTITPLPPCHPLPAESRFNAGELCLLRPLRLSQLTALVQLNQLLLKLIASDAGSTHAAVRSRPPMYYVEERKFGGPTQLFVHPMCEFPGFWHPAGVRATMAEADEAAVTARRAMAWLAPLMQVSFDRAVLLARPSSTSASLIRQRSSDTSAVRSNDAMMSNEAESEQKRRKTKHIATEAVPFTLGLSGVQSMDHCSAAAFNAGASSAAAAAASAPAAATCGSTSAVHGPAVSLLDLEIYVKWLLQVSSRSHLLDSAELRWCALPFPYSTHAWLCPNHRELVERMEAQYQTDSSSSTPLHPPASWRTLHWEPIHMQPQGGSSSASAAAAAPSVFPSSYGQFSMLPSNASAFVRVSLRCGHLFWLCLTLFIFCMCVDVSCDSASRPCS